MAGRAGRSLSEPTSLLDIKFISISLDLVPLISSLVVLTLICGYEGCDYAHVDPMHTMCVFAPRMCSQRKLLRE